MIGPGNNLTQGYGLVALNLLLPLAVTVLRGMIASLNPLSKYAVLKGDNCFMEPLKPFAPVIIRASQIL